MSQLSWKDIFDCKIWYGHISVIARKAHLAGYEYFVWNDRVYKIKEVTVDSVEWSDMGEVDYVVKEEK